MQPVIELAPAVAARYAVAIALFAASMHYLVSGRKEASVNRMITGALLAFACLAVLL